MARRVSVMAACATAALVACGGHGPANAAPPSGPSGPGDPTSPTGPTEPTGPAACAGLVPGSPGPGIAYVRGPLGPGICRPPVTDGHGEWIGVGIGLKRYGYVFVSATAPGQPTGSLSVPVPYDGRSVIAPQPDGYHVAGTADAMPGPFLRYDGMGNLLSDDGVPVAEDVEGLPGGGSVADTVEGFPSANELRRLVWRGADGERVADVVGATLVAVSSTGNVLAWSDGKLRWYDRFGAPRTGWFPDPVGLPPGLRYLGSFPAPLALADGSVVVLLGTERAARFEAGATAASPVPSWVSARAGAVFANVRGGRANAFARITSGAGAACAVEIEILTAAGETCGTTRLEAPAPCQRVDIGADRTVFTTGGAQPDACTWRWWSGLLR